MTARLRDLTDRILGASATLIAVIALATAVYQSKLMRDQARAAVLPYLVQGNSGNNGYSRIVQNLGVGPAKIRAFEVMVDGKVVHNWKEVADSLHIALSWKGHTTTTFTRGLVVPAGSMIELLNLPDSNDVRAFRAAIGEHLQTYICFCSLYEECWESRPGDYEPRETKACVEDRSRRFID